MPEVIFPDKLEIAVSYCTSLGFKLVLELDFCIRKNFINTMTLKWLRKEEQVKGKLSREYTKRFVL